MAEWSDESMCEGLRNFSGTDTRERFYEAVAARIEELTTEGTELRKCRDAVGKYFHNDVQARNELLNTLDEIDRRLATVSGSPGTKGGNDRE